jgi:hypothetical protein
MPQITTYATLQQAVKDRLNRDDLTNDIPLFIQLAEAGFDRDIRWRKQLVRDVTTANERYENLPADLLEIESIRFNTTPVVRPDYLSPRQLDLFVGRNPGLTGTPHQYTIVNNEIQFDRTPDGIELELSSYVRLPRLSDAAPTNVLLEEHPDIYFYAALTQAELHLKNDARAGTWGTLYLAAVNALHKQDKRAAKSPGPLTIKSRRVF